MKTERVLLLKNDNLINAQSDFNESLIDRLNSILAAFNKIGLKEKFEQSDLKELLNGNPLSIIKQKAAP
ncbi:MAG TPA: hypothetical protein DGG95_01975, partial [Cytophagales bacterium]|nr:hypothetical protein [Cytophagales bacterium]